MPEFNENKVLIDQIDMGKLSPRCRALVALLTTIGYPHSSLVDVTSNIPDERDLFDLLKFLSRHWRVERE